MAGIVDLGLLLIALLAVGLLSLRHWPPPALPPKTPIGFR